jgi:hypothetical protein
LNTKEEEENYCIKPNKEMLAYFGNKFKDDSSYKHKSHCIGDLALLFVNIFGRMLLTVRLENMKKMFRILGTLCDSEVQKVIIRHSIIK